MQVKKAEKLNNIIDAATELFSSKDFHEVKLDEVAKRACVGKGTIYTYFKSKDELLAKCLLHNVPAIHEEMSQIAASTNLTFEKAFKALIKIQYKLISKKGSLIQQFMDLGPTLKLSEENFRALKKMFTDSLKMLAEFFQKAIDSEKVFSNLSAKQIAIIFQEILDINVLFSFHDEPEMHPDDAYTFFMKMFGRK